MPGIASAATSVVIGHVAGGTKTIRVGAGGIMLPNHAPLVIAEQFGTLESLFPGRIDLGVGPRAGHRPADGARAAPRRSERRRVPAGRAWSCRRYFREPAPGQTGAGGSGRRTERSDLDPGLEPVRRAARRRSWDCRLPSRRISRRRSMMAAIEMYRSQFSPRQPRERSSAPISCSASTSSRRTPDAEARRLFTSHQQIFLALRRGRLGPVPPPVNPDRFDAELTPLERAELEQRAVLGDRRIARDRPPGCFQTSSTAPAPTSSSSPRQYLTIRRD